MAWRKLKRSLKRVFPIQVKAQILITRGSSSRLSCADSVDRDVFMVGLCILPSRKSVSLSKGPDGCPKYEISPKILDYYFRKFNRNCGDVKQKSQYISLKNSCSFYKIYLL